jgi:hypothetical protein
MEEHYLGSQKEHICCNTSVLYALLLYFVFGLVLSPLNRGIAWIIIFGLLGELYYGYQISGKYKTRTILLRFALFSAGLLGYFIGRVVIVKDKTPL